MFHYFWLNLLIFLHSLLICLLTELQKKMAEKQDHLLSKTGDAENLFENHNISKSNGFSKQLSQQKCLHTHHRLKLCLCLPVLAIIKMQDKLWFLQKQPASETSVDRVEG